MTTTPRSIAGGITKDTRLCLSLAARPSNIGTRFHNYLYDELGLDFVYKAFTTNDIVAAIAGVRGLQIRGAAVSMPWKEDVIAHVDEMDQSASAIESVNTIVNNDGRLVAYNTDYIALRDVLAAHQVDPASDFVVMGSGGMAKAAVAALVDSGFTTGCVVARNEATGRALADKYGVEWASELGERRPRLVMNATPVGMTGGPQADALSVPREAVEASETVFDVVAFPSRTPLIRLAEELGKAVISGAEVIALQALEQFVLYTGVRPTPEQAQRAAEFSRA